MQDKRKLAIEVDNVQKIYKLYDKPSDRLKEAFGFGKKTKHKLHYALKGVSMKIYQGETVGIIGTNGSGKSTILKIITGVLNPTSGGCWSTGVSPLCWSWVPASIWNTTVSRMSI